MKYYKCDAKTAEENIKDMFPPTQATSLPFDILERLSTDKVTVIAAYLGDQEKSGVFGRLIGYAKLDEPIVLEQEDFYNKGEHIHVETEYISFMYTVYLSDQKRNYMSNIKPFYAFPLIDFPDDENCKKMLAYHREHDRARIQLENSAQWGWEGFLEDIRTEELSGNDLTCRLFIENVTKVSKGKRWVRTIKRIKNNAKE